MTSVSPNRGLVKRRAGIRWTNGEPYTATAWWSHRHHQRATDQQFNNASQTVSLKVSEEAACLPPTKVMSNGTIMSYLLWHIWQDGNYAQGSQRNKDQTASNPVRNDSQMRSRRGTILSRRGFVKKGGAEHPTGLILKSRRSFTDQ